MRNIKVSKGLVHVLRIIFGSVFIYSALAKLYPVEGFELFILENSFLSWNLSTLIARLLIALELGLGVLLCLNVYSKRIQQFAIILLAGFTIYLLYLHFSSKNIENCNCFGSHLVMTPLESVFKNIVLLGVAFLLYKNRTEFRFKNQTVFTIIIAAFVVSLPFILSPPDFMIKNRYHNEVHGTLNVDELAVDFVFEGNAYDLTEGKWIICFYGTGCKFCKMSNNKISRFIERHDLPEKIFIFFLSSDEDVHNFWAESNSNGFPYEILTPAEFFTVGGNRLPSIFFIEDKEIVHHCLYRDLFEEDVKDFLSEK